MNEQHDAIAAVLIGKCDHRGTGIERPCEPTAAIEALRKGAKDRLDDAWTAALQDHRPLPTPTEIVNAILGNPQDEVTA